MRIERDAYIDKLKEKMWNGSVKVIAGLRRSGKSFILFNLFKEYLMSNGTGEDEIVEVQLDDIANRDGRYVYIQSAFSIPDDEKMDQEKSPLRHVKSSFPKIMIRMDTLGRWYDDEGYLHINLLDFLMDKNLV